jgi:uncharacterized membrane protein YccC
MLEHTTVTRPLSSANDLAAFHARRERFYSVAAQLLAGPPDEHLLDTARRLLGRAASGCRDLVAALGDERGRAAAAEHALLFTALGVDTGCRVAGDDSDLVAELTRLATLADQLAVAIQAGDMTDAAALSDEQAHFLHDHAGTCVAGHADRIAGAGGPFYRALGHALAQQIADDVRLLSD